MSIRKRTWKIADGETRVAWMVDVIDASGHRERRQFASKKEAEAFRIATEGAMRAGQFRAEAAKLTVEDAARAFLAHCLARHQRGERMTLRNYKTMEGHVWNYICPDSDRPIAKGSKRRTFEGGIARLKLSQLTQRTIGDLRDRLRDAGVAVVTTRKILATVQLILSHAVSQDWTASNVARGVRVIGRRDEGSRKIVPPTKAVMRALVEAADPVFRVKLVFASATGVRAGELHALRWHHVDFGAAELKVETRVDAYGEEDVTKTAAGMRTIPLARHVVVLLKEWRLRSTYKKPSDLIFANRDGTYVDHDLMVKRKFKPLFARLVTADGDPSTFEPFNWHALRHFAISCWIESGLNPKTVQTFAGHSSLQVTMDRYGHLFKSEDHRAVMDHIADELFA